MALRSLAMALDRGGRGLGWTYRTRRSAVLEIEATQQIACGLQAVGAAGAQVGQRLKVLGERRRRARETVLAPWPADQRGLGRMRSRRNRRQAAKGNPGGADAIAHLIHEECRTHRGD